MVHAARLGHPGGDLSAADILAALFFRSAAVRSAANPRDPDRDRFILSKGHCSGGALRHPGRSRVLPARGLSTLHAAALAAQRPPGPQQGAGRRSQHRPARARPADRAWAPRTPRRWPAPRGGHSSSPATANCRRAATGKPPWRRPVRAGQPDRHRGPQPAPAGGRHGAHRRASNRSPIGGAPSAGPWSKWTATITRPSPAPSTRVPFEAGRPSCVIAHTHKGRGVSFMEDRVEWHHRVPTDVELDLALKELGWDGAKV